jgi:hypothetical protein
MPSLSRPLLVLALTLFGVSHPAYAAAPTVQFTDLHNDAVLHNPITVHFAVTGMAVKPAGDMTPNSGHVHLLIDTTLTPEQLDYAIPTDAQHIHYGKGQTEATLTLPKGKHTLQLVMGDGGHVPHKPPVLSQPLSVTVE